MPYVRLHAEMLDSERWIAVAADPRIFSDMLAVWVATACYSAQNLTDGFIPAYRLAGLLPFSVEGLCPMMVAQGILAPAERQGLKGWELVDWQESIDSAQTVKARRARNAGEAKRSRDKHRARPINASVDHTIPCLDSVSHIGADSAPESAADGHGWAEDGSAREIEAWDEATKGPRFASGTVLARKVAG